MTCVCSFEHDSFAWRERAECVRVLVEIRPLEFPGFLPHFSGECLLARHVCAMVAPVLVGLFSVVGK